MFSLPDPCMFCGGQWGCVGNCPTQVNRPTLPAFPKPKPRCTLPRCKDEDTLDSDGKVWKCWRCGTAVPA